MDRYGRFYTNTYNFSLTIASNDENFGSILYESWYWRHIYKYLDIPYKFYLSTLKYIPPYRLLEWIDMKGFYTSAFNFSQTIVFNDGNFGSILCESWYWRHINGYLDVPYKLYLPTLKPIPPYRLFEWIDMEGF